MNAERFQLLMDVLEVNDRQMAKKLKVSHPTVIRWRTGKTDIPGTAEVAIDCIFGDGVPGSAGVKAALELKKEWMGFVRGLSIEELTGIAKGLRAIEYEKGSFGLGNYTEDLGCWQIYNDAGDFAERPACQGDQIIDLLCDKGIEEGEYEEELKNLVAEAERSKMFQFLAELEDTVLMEIYDHNMKKIDEDINED